MTDSRSAAGRTLFPLSAAQRVSLLIAAVAAAAVTLFVIVVMELESVPSGTDLPWVAWVAAFAIAEIVVVHVHLQRDSHSFSLTDLALVAGLYLLEPVALVTAQVVGTGLALAFHRRQSGTKLAFNMAQYALGGCLASLVFVAAVQVGPASVLWQWAAALLAVSVTTISADLCILAAMRLSDATANARELARTAALSMPFTLGVATVGLLVARTAVHDPLALVLLTPPAVLLVAAYRAYAHARKQETNLRLLHEVTSQLYDSSDATTALTDFLGSVRAAFRSGLAELILVESRDGGATVSRNRDGQEPLALVALDEADEVLQLVECATGSGRPTIRTGAHARGLDDYAMRRGLKNAMVSVLRTEDRVQGLLLVGDRRGDVATFTGGDLALLETFARHLGTSLDRGRLEHDLRTVTDLKEKLRHQAMHDALTGLPNRTLFLDRTQQALHLAGRNGEWPAVVYIDLDGFKPVNDTYGHEAGDVLLRAFADRLGSCLRSADTPARLGGDEFAVLLHGPIDEFGVQQVLDRIRGQLQLSVDLGAGRSARVGASIGVAIAGAGLDVDTVVRHADVAMYAAKRGGRGRDVFYEEGLGEEEPERTDPGAELAGALDRGEFAVAYQPLVDVGTGRPHGAEALVRWQHPTEGTRPPDTFIPLAEETGLIWEIGSFVLREACRQAARWNVASGHGPLMVTVNLSARQLLDPRITDEVRAALAGARLEPSLLGLEITESVLMHDREAAVESLAALKALGVHIAIDDFGTGYSSLAYLCRFPLDLLKVPREFVDGLGRDPNAELVTRAVLELAGALGLRTVAEGIETHQQLERVAQLGCELAQGYLFSRPVDAETVLSFLTDPMAGAAPLPGPTATGTPVPA